ncbi:MAG: nickel pincer cofactor biosynthesis protein LarC [Desulfobacterota bacterium]|nr:nickel pincer cofactor biosynthesis protein LarC [Thermodesulfobacteriota bacterium]MDW8001833.1 nickel pincer cofactor biosynthesis protein LarC [Deltaproteobacteria bacterium]
MKVLYIDCVSGLSGDMLVSAFIDAGFPQEEVERALGALPIKAPKITQEKVVLGPIRGVRIKIERSNSFFTCDEMLDIVSRTTIDEKIKSDVTGMLNVLFDAEAKIHGVAKEDLHLHELADIDTLLDFLLVASAVAYFGIEKIFVGSIPHGSGILRTSHGLLPNPPPLTLEILKGFPSIFKNSTYELTTPTGAAIVRYYANPTEPFPGMRISVVGYGFGNYEMEEPDILRVFIGEQDASYLSEKVYVIEFDIDDMDMEYTGLLSERLRGLGALDVLTFPVFMKKGRVGLRFSVTATKEKLEDLIDRIFEESTTFGLRIREESRRVLRRDERIVKCKYGEVRIKVGYGKQNRVLKEHIEYDDVKRISEEYGLPYRIVLDEVKKELYKEK